MTYQESIQYIHSFINYEVIDLPRDKTSFKLKRVELLLNSFDHPDKKIKIIHVAGSKGKGSTCSMIAGILKASGKKVGLYTSPHINDLRERIRIVKSDSVAAEPEDLFDDCISPQKFSQLMDKLKVQIDRINREEQVGPFSFFEIMTVAAMVYFKQEQVDVAVIETGLGGLLDATNVFDTDVVVLTPISLEHTHILGDTIAKIATEKSGIIKNKKQKVIIGEQTEEALEVIEERCQLIEAQPIRIHELIHIEQVETMMDGQLLRLRMKEGQSIQLKLNLHGKHQVMNALTAIGASSLLFNLTDWHFLNGLNHIQWPGRFELFNEYPMTILDCAHNRSSAKALAETYREVFGDVKINLILGFSRDKDIRGICEELDVISDTIILTQADHPRSLTPDVEKIGQYFKNTNIVLTKNIEEALTVNGKNNVLVAGSIFIMSETRRKLCTNIKV